MSGDSDFLEDRRKNGTKAIYRIEKRKDGDLQIFKNRELLCDKLGYLLVEDKGLLIVHKDFVSEHAKKNRYKFRITY